MQPDRPELEARYREMSDEELWRRIDGGNLTDLALEVALAEAASRGLRGEAQPAAGHGVEPARGSLKIATRFLLPVDAHVFAARLEQEGIEAHVMDADTIYAVGAFMGSLARGGVRVMVPESQLADAERILAAYNAGEYAIDENFDPGE